MSSILETRQLETISHPSRYLGNEVNRVQKDPSSTEIFMALAFPDVYEVGMSHLGLKILYDLLNARTWLAAERVFSPWPDMEHCLRTRGEPLATLESGRPLHACDIVGFSVQHELCFTNILNILDLGGIPLRPARRRPTEAPLIIAGGPACFNPEPIAEFFDLCVIGDGELVTPAICEVVRDWKSAGAESRGELLKHLSRRFDGVYVPSLFRPRYGNNGTIEAMEPLDPCRSFVNKAIVPSIEEIPYPEKQLVPFTELIHDRLAVEIARGCTRGCRFCQAGMVYRPVRERNPSTIVQIAERALAATGYDDLSLLSLSTGDYSRIESLLIRLMDCHEEEKIALSLPSLRVDSLSPILMEQIKRVRKTGFTLAVEAGNEKLRRVINKGLSQEEILQTADIVYQAGWNLIKLYCMIGLPLETDHDLKDMVDLARDVAKLASRISKRNRLNLSISTFVPKAHTPFMWCPQISLEESQRRLRLIQEPLRRSPVKVKWNQPEMSWMEGVFSRGDRRLADAIEAAWRKGARFDAWAEHFRRDIWMGAFAETAIDPAFYNQRERAFNEILPWDHIRSGVTKSFLNREWERARQGLLTPDCRKKCLECGVCDHSTIDPVLAEAFPPSQFHPVPQAGSEEGQVRYLLTFSKLGRAVLLGHMELSRAFLRAFRRAGVKLKYSQGFHPLPKVTFTYALPLGTESLQETMVIEVPSRLDTHSVKIQLNRHLPEGISISEITNLKKGTGAPRIKRSRYSVRFDGLDLSAAKLELFNAAEDFTVVKKTKKGEHVLDIRPLITSFKFAESDELELVILHPEGPQVRPADAIKAVFQLDDSEIPRLQVRKIQQFLT